MQYIVGHIDVTYLIQIKVLSDRIFLELKVE